MQGDAASIIALKGVCLQIAVENDPGALHRQRPGITSRYHAFLTDAVSSADIDKASGRRNYPLSKVALVQDRNRTAGNVSESGSTA